MSSQGSWFSYILKHKDDKRWNWTHLSANPLATWEIIHAHPELPWNFNQVSENPNITADIIMKNPRHDWNNFLFTANPNFEFAHTFMTAEIFGENAFEWNWVYMTFHKNITWDIIQNNAYRHWYAAYVSRNPNIPVELIRKYLSNPASGLFELPPGTHGKLWNPRFLCSNPKLTWDIVQEFSDYPWTWHLLSKNPSITWEHISQNLQYPWNWHSVSENPTIRWSHVKSCLHQPWNWTALSKHPNVTFDIIFANPDLPWDSSAFNLNPNLTWDIVDAHPEIIWNHYLISQNPMPSYSESDQKQRCLDRCALLKDELLFCCFHRVH